MSCLPVRPVPRKLGCNSSSLSLIHSLIPLNWSCVWIGSSVWQLCQPWWMQRKAMAFCQRDTTAPWWSWQGSSAVPAQKVTPWHICLLCWWCSCLLPFSRSFYRCGGSSWLPLLLTPSRSHQLLEALSSPDVAPVQESLLSTPLQDSAANCAGTGAAWHQNCSLQQLSTARHCKSF